MAVLHLGVVDVAYSDPNKQDLTTTGEIAEILEKNFEVIGTFYEIYGQKIADIMADSMSKELAAMAKGEPLGGQPIETAMQKIEALFRSYLDNHEWEQTTGITIAAAHQGISHRFKDVMNDKGERGKRPAFVDTGLYQASFRTWLDMKLRGF